MKNVFKFLADSTFRNIRIAFLSLFIFLATTTQTQAVSSCRGVMAGGGVTLPKWESGDTHTIKIDMKDWDPDEKYYLKIKGGENSDDEAVTKHFNININKTYPSHDGTVTVKDGVVTWVVKEKEALQNYFGSGENDTHYVYLYRRGDSNSNKLCEIGTYQTTKNDTGGDCKLFISQSRRGDTCYVPGCSEAGKTNTTIEVEGLADGNGDPFTGQIRFVIGTDGWPSAKDDLEKAVNGKATGSFKADPEGTYTVFVEEVRAGENYKFPDCDASFQVEDYCDDRCEETRTDVSAGAVFVDFKLCEQIPEGERGDCEACLEGGSDGIQGIWTAIGCIPAKPESIIKTFMTLGLSIGGGAALLLILAGAFRLSVSQGDAQATKDAQEQITSAIIGLVFIILSITMLRFIGVSLFQIPGFGG